MCMKAPKIQAPPPMPTPAAETMDQSAGDARARERKRRMAMAGRQSTILTGSQGTGTAAQGAKTLLGS